jgi:mono/diheme cytochrome c family protein
MNARIAAPLLSLALLQCAPPSNTASDASTDAGPVPTWYEDIAPFAYAQCGNCHQPGGIGPFDITNWQEVQPRAVLIAHETAARTMPPMPVDNSGSCHTFSNARYLTDEQIAMIQNWATHGAPEGNPANEPPHAPPLPTLANPTATLDIGLDYMPSPPPGGRDDYRCFLVDPGNAADTFVTGYEVVPGDPRVVHHVIVYAFSDAQGATQAQMLDDADAAPGYQCFGGAGVSGAEPIALWAPGAGAMTFPNATGVQLPGARRVAVQIHYNTDNGTFPDRTRVRLATSDANVTRAYFAPIANGNLSLPPGMASVSSSHDVSLSALPIPVRIWGALPHMHQLGRTLRVDRMSGSTTSCIVDTPRWNFHWQGVWWYDAPLRVSPSDSLRITCTYDTSSRSTTTTWGEGTSDEMCLAFFYVSP